MGWTFTSFDSAAATTLTSGSLPVDLASRVRAALLWDPYRAETEEEQKKAATLAEHFCSAGLAATYAQCAPADLPLLDGLFVGLFEEEAGLAELRTRGHIDPWGWKALAALISFAPKPAASQILLSGRRPGSSVPLDAASGNFFVVLTAEETATLSKELSQAMHAYLPSAKDWSRGGGPFPEWEVDEFQSAMTSLAEAAKEGRSVLAHYG